MSEEGSSETERGTHGENRLGEEEAQYRKRLEFIKNMLNNMNEEQLTRFEFASQSHLPKGHVRDIMQDICGSTSNITDEMVIIVSGLTKLFLSEVVDTALDVVKEGKTGGQSIRVDHLREAYRRMQLAGTVGGYSDSSFLMQTSLAIDEDDLISPYYSDEENLSS